MKTIKEIVDQFKVEMTNAIAPLADEDADYREWVMFREQEARLYDHLQTTLTSHTESILETLEGLKEKHWVFECNGAHGGKGCYETWCDDKSRLGPCTSKEAAQTRAHNEALDSAIQAIKSSL